MEVWGPQNQTIKASKGSECEKVQNEPEGVSAGSDHQSKFKVILIGQIDWFADLVRSIADGIKREESTDSEGSTRVASRFAVPQVETCPCIRHFHFSLRPDAARRVDERQTVPHANEQAKMPAQFALLGSTGTVGSAILQTLLRPASSAHVTLLVRSPGKLPAEVKGDGRVTVLTGDMDDAAAVKSVVKGGKDGVIAALNEQDVGRRLKQFGHLVAVSLADSLADINPID